MTKLQPLVENIPELVLIAARGQRHIGQIQSDHALIEPPVVFVLAGNVVLRVCDVADTGIGEAVGRQEGTTAHAGIHVALQFQHLFLNNFQILIRQYNPFSWFYIIIKTVINSRPNAKLGIRIQLL